MECFGFNLKGDKSITDKSDKSETRNRQEKERERARWNFLLSTNKLASVVFGLAWIKGLFRVAHCWLDNGTVLDGLLATFLCFIAQLVANTKMCP